MENYNMNLKLSEPTLQTEFLRVYWRFLCGTASFFFEHNKYNYCEKPCNVLKYIYIRNDAKGEQNGTEGN